MQKLKISRVEAYGKFVEGDFEVMNDEIDSLFSQSKEFNKAQTMHFFFLPERDLVLLEVYWDGVLVSDISFG